MQCFLQTNHGWFGDHFFQKWFPVPCFVSSGWIDGGNRRSIILLAGHDSMASIDWSLWKQWSPTYIKGAANYLGWMANRMYDANRFASTQFEGCENICSWTTEIDDWNEGAHANTHFACALFATLCIEETLLNHCVSLTIETIVEGIARAWQGGCNFCIIFVKACASCFGVFGILWKLVFLRPIRTTTFDGSKAM